MQKIKENEFEVLREILPSQGPLEFFVHHNTFHCMEKMPFKEALLEGKKLYDGKVLKSEIEYRLDFKNNKIMNTVLQKVLDKFCQENLFTKKSQRQFLKNIFFVNEDYIKKEIPLIDDIIELQNAKGLKSKFISYGLIKDFDIAIDEVISPTIFRFLSLYFDQGVSYWKMPGRERGLLNTFKNYYQEAPFFASKWERNLAKLIRKNFNKANNEIINLLLSELNLDANSSDYLFDLCLRYKGWGGLILSFEKHPEWNKRSDIKVNYEDFITVLLLCEYAFFTSLDLAKQKRINENLPYKVEENTYSNSFLLSANELIITKYKNESTGCLLDVVKALTDFERCFLWHLAYEETFYIKFLESFKAHQEQIIRVDKNIDLQVLCCIDDREESFRRYMESLDDKIETFGVAGHFGLDIQYKGLFSANYRSLCPDIVKPSKKIFEKLDSGKEVVKIYGLWAKYLWIQTLSSKTLIRGLVFQLLTGFTSIFSLSLSVLSPYLSYKIKNHFKKSLDKKLKTSLVYFEGSDFGMTFLQMVEHSKVLLKTIGLTKNFSPVVVILGHGSHSLNNPHEAAHDCGACGGGRGAPNARLMAAILNREDVRIKLKRDSICIPENTYFIGGYHNTCSDEVLFFDVPDGEIFKNAVNRIRSAARLDALERCRKYEDVSLNITADKAYLHCLGRASSYMQPRPEYGHATNSICYVGPRWMSEKLFLDRRAFLTSYEPDQDNETTDILKSILSAVGPVCSGINLEYYFSYMDNEIYGCGTKLPHNVTSLVGVMNGYQSDLQMGLPWQMVEIHDPYRLMLLVVCGKKKMENLIELIPNFGQLVKNDWIHLSIFDHHIGQMYRYKDQKLVEEILETSELVEYSNSKEAFSMTREACRLGIVRGLK